ncbi:MAG: class I SAM-dependent methyltransferase [Mesorhizobium sp.]|uniref:class I SAM-dependent methyltransferase n=1 Tax=Mesorhizobium sp. TaxID=1871066 RepID=UPI000FE898F1|nr:class I SAM-dependent methyltransferase [Mesorhizobium sp.]RWM46128.1 MAG: class I SAM-dependent methyltransferase [Mesorhizobium sp.]RWM89168.1 MAG: class I SAM-dependent methyltransferase [Mesorhizobium sp.]
MSISDQAALERIKASHALDGDAARLAHFFCGWARSYDSDVGREEYCAPTVVAELASAVQTAYLPKDRAATEILDAGCGTGLVGGQMKRLGLQLPDGFDLSDEVAEKARQIRVYRHVKATSTSTGRAPITPVRVRYYSLPRRFHARACLTRRDCANWLASPFERFVIKNSQSYATETYSKIEAQRLQKVSIIVAVYCVIGWR